MAKRVIPDGHRDAIATAMNLALTYGALGRHAEALPLEEQALATYRRLFEGDHPDVAMSLNHLASTYGHLGRLAEALPLEEQALAIYRRLFERDHPDVAMSLNHLASTYGALGRHAEALPLKEEALAMYRRLFEGDHPDVARSLNNLAFTYGALGRDAEVLPLNQQALAMRRRLFKGDHPDVALSLNNLASTYDALGRHAEALPLYDEAYRMGQRLGAADRWRWATNFGRQLLHLDRPREALDPLRAAVAALEVARANAASLRVEARDRYLASLREWGDPYEALARAHLALGDPEAALDVLESGRGRGVLDVLARTRFDPMERALTRARQSGDETKAERLERLRYDLARSEQEVNRLTHAVAHASKRQDLSPEQRGGLAAQRKDELVEARRAHETLLAERAREVKDAIELARPASAGEVRALLSGSKRLLLYRVGGADAHLLLVGPPGTPTGVFELVWPDGEAVDAASITEAVDAYRVSLRRDGGGRGALPAGGGPAREKAKPDSSAVGHRLFRALVPQEAWDVVAKAEHVVVLPHGALHRLPFEALVVEEASSAKERRYWLDVGPAIRYGASGSVLRWCKKQRDAQRGRTPALELAALGGALFEKLAERLEPPGQGVLLLSVPADSPGGRAGLAAGDVLTAYGETPTGDHKALREAIHSAQAAFEDGERDDSGVAVTLWRAGSEHTLRVPLGRLGVDVASAPPRAAWKRYFDDRPQRIASVERSGTLARYGTLDYLPGTRREVLAIHKHLTGEPWREDPAGVEAAASAVRLLLGEEATETHLARLAPRARYVHLATHGLADETEKASYSSLALTLPAIPTPQDDGFLKLVDLFEHWRDRLAACELVVLSACETQVGPVQKDEGVFALPLGFHYAGCPSVIASLWRVDDESTAALMSDFYARLADPERETTKLEAFTAARKALRERCPQPYHWAPFVYLGDPR